MGQFTLGVIDSTVGNISFPAEVATEDITRIIVAYGARFGIEPNSVENVTEIIRLWWKMVIDNARADTLAYEQQKAAKAAAEAVQIIQVIMAGN